MNNPLVAAVNPYGVLLVLVLVFLAGMFLGGYLADVRRYRRDRGWP